MRSLMIWWEPAQIASGGRRGGRVGGQLTDHLADGIEGLHHLRSLSGHDLVG